MATKRRKKSYSHSKKTQKRINKPIVALLSVLLSAFVLVSISDDFGFKYIPTMSQVKEFFTPKSSSGGGGEADCSVHFIDVQQGDSTLIISDGKTILIDAGENDKGKVVVDYLKKLNIKKIDMLVATHPHSDHIGGMDTIINEFEIGKIVMPKLKDSIVPTTRTYTDVLTAIATKGLKITPSKPGMAFDFGRGRLVIIAPIGDFEDLNDTSLVARFSYDDKSFLFTGDMEKKAEKELLKTKATLKSDVLKAGHHGSSTSSHAAFLDAVSPSYAAIPVGDDNKYKHPSKSTITEFEKRKIKYFRTDYDGDIVFSIIDGKFQVKTREGK